MITPANRSLIESQMLKKRTITSAWYAALLVVIVWFGGGPGFSALVATLGVLAALEFYRMVAILPHFMLPDPFEPVCFLFKSP